LIRPKEPSSTNVPIGGSSQNAVNFITLTPHNRLTQGHFPPIGQNP
jgi:hypothetical protein